MSPDERIDNSPIVNGGYRPRNYAERYSPAITLRDAFAGSSNVAAVRLLAKVGDKRVIRLARDMGVTAPFTEGDPSLALGTSGMTLLELTGAYAAVAANRYPVRAHALPEEEQGWLAQLISGPSRFPERVHSDIEAMLKQTVDTGTGRGAAFGRAAFGKTGTSQDSRDALFVGYAGDLVVGVWIGNDDNTPLKGMTGGGLPAQIWRDFMRQALAPAKPAPRPKPDPGGPVEPLDLPGPAGPAIGASAIRIQNGKAVITTEVGGQTIDLQLDLRDGSASSARIEQLRREAEAGASQAAAAARRR